MHSRIGEIVDTPVAEIKHVNYLDRVYASLELLALRDRSPVASCDLRLAEHRIFSQNGEDGVIDALVRILGSGGGNSRSMPFFVEFGVGDGWSCNTRLLAEVRDWEGLYIEVDRDDFDKLSHRYRFSDAVTCVNASVTPENVSEIFRAAGVPGRFGVLSIDIDGQDFWVWKALSDDFQPDIVVIEFNAEHEPGEMTVESRDVDRDAALGRRWGASLDAQIGLASAKGYELVHIDMARVNAFFVARDVLLPFRELISGRTSPGSPNYGLRGTGLADEVAFTSPNRTERETVQADLFIDL